jgi:hypothetical protein
MDYQELIMNKASDEIRQLLSLSSDEFRKEWDGLIHFTTNENNELVGPALNESAFNLLGEKELESLRHIKEKYFDN